VHDALVVDEHAVGHGVVIADDGVHQLMHEGVSVELEGRDRERDHLREEGRAGLIGVLPEPASQAGGDALGRRHAGDAGGMLHHAPGLREGELAEQEEALARLGGDPVGVAASGIEERGLGGLRGLLGELDQLVFDLERAHLVELFEVDGHGCLLDGVFTTRA
jgi:hypothetical protein